MRHTFATLAISVGENINWGAQMLGHKSPKVTLERYNRYVPNLTRDDGRELMKTGARKQKFR
jgi:integrase